MVPNTVLGSQEFNFGETNNSGEVVVIKHLLCARHWAGSRDKKINETQFLLLRS